ncbi:carbohydrate kinase [Gimesia sp.]|uniref:carbohydrate kinase family protein n=1 Tax=Gimesia sp. TaxID=2024833 RepID=UPI000C3C05E0|nr:carbohydrate kinase [Gimesia sp.]MAX36898.1 carbohydrate kinase [Gimesia sp.]HBL43620.1 carbohydrate kinase [Planctomycetaceae bacterium]|tara:strand:- start:780 stop:1700 length:921 start_codon:yes stop_codon:yes gene_type:complete
MNNINSLPLVIGLGELLWDCFEDERRPGGAPANVAFQANQLGCRGTVVTRVGQDELGNELLEFLKQQGLSVDHVQVDESFPTGTVTVQYSDANDPQYTIHEQVAWDHLEFNEDLSALMQQSQAVCFGTLAQREPASREAIHQCLAATTENCLVVYDVNLRQDYYERSWMESSLAAAKMVKLNQDEVDKLSEILGLSIDSPRQFADQIQKDYQLDAICITRGAEGCLIYSDGQEYDIPGSPVEVVDAVGAGDAFTAALISRRLLGWDWRQAALFANRVGGLVASQAGAMPVLKQEFEQLSQEIQNSL